MTALMVCAVMVKTDILYPDEYTRQALLDNVLITMDEAAQMEDERLAGQGAADDIIPILEPARPSLPDANLAEPWTGFKAR